MFNLNPSFPPKNQNPYRMAACPRNFCYLLVVIFFILFPSTLDIPSSQRSHIETTPISLSAAIEDSLT